MSIKSIAPLLAICALLALIMGFPWLLPPQRGLSAARWYIGGLAPLWIGAVVYPLLLRILAPDEHGNRLLVASLGAMMLRIAALVALGVISTIVNDVLLVLAGTTRTPLGVPLRLGIGSLLPPIAMLSDRRDRRDGP